MNRSMHYSLTVHTKDCVANVQVLFSDPTKRFLSSYYDECEQNCQLKMSRESRYSLSLLPQSVQKLTSWVGTEFHLYFYVMYLLRDVLVAGKYLATGLGTCEYSSCRLSFKSRFRVFVHTNDFWNDIWLATCKFRKPRIQKCTYHRIYSRTLIISKISHYYLYWGNCRHTSRYTFLRCSLRSFSRKRSPCEHANRTINWRNHSNEIYISWQFIRIQWIVFSVESFKYGHKS